MRAAGILLPVFSLASPYGIGTLGADAFAFVDFLKQAGQRYWQLLPIGPTGYGDSPYQSFSSFAGNPYLIDLDRLVEQGLLLREECEAEDFGSDERYVEYGKLFANRLPLLRRAYERFDRSDANFAAFCEQNGFWLDDYALFMSLKAAHDMVSFQDWEAVFRLRKPFAIHHFIEEHRDEIAFYRFTQYLFYSQWRELKRYANGQGVELIGDIPIYVSPDSADLWANGNLFCVDDSLHMTEVAGCPPDAFATTGQLWGNPLYRWSAHEQDGFSWWVERLRFCCDCFDMVRIDHFRGLESYYAIPADAETAEHGVWKKGPGMALIEAIRRQLPQARIIAEDLGFLTDEVKELLKQSGYPGMKVLQFAFDNSENGEYLPHRYPRNAVAYSGTHDNRTTAEWRDTAADWETAFAREYLGLPAGEGNLAEALLRATLRCACDWAIIPMQDYLGLGAEARMNIPSTREGNWRWRLTPGELTPQLAGEIGRMTAIYGRVQNGGNHENRD